MKSNRILLMSISLIILMMSLTAVSASINETDVLQDELNFDDSDTIHLSNNTYRESDITISKSVTIIGNDTTFDGEGQSSLFTITNSSQVTIENIKFINYYKESNGAVFDIEKTSSLILKNCTFVDNVMAINNRGSLSVHDSCFYNNNLTSQYSHGGAIANEGTLYIENSLLTNSYGPKYTNGATIYNNGDLTINKTTISDAYAAEESKGSAIFNNGQCLLLDSIIERNTIERYNFNYMHGAVYNQGNLTARGNLFRNNTGKYVKPNTWYEGSPTIYNVGNLNLSYNAFISNVYFKGLSVDVFSNGARYITLDNNWWASNGNPLDENKVNEGNVISSWIVLSMTPEYSALDINESVLIRASWKLSTGDEISENLLPEFNITMSDGERTIIGDSFLFNRTQTKGLYTVTASVPEFTMNATVDVGKIPVYLYLTANDITYPEDLFMEFISNVDQNITVTLNDKKYVLTVVNGKANLTVSNLNAKSYRLDVAYEGDEDHFRAFNQTTVTVNKMPVTLSLENIHDIMVDETINAKIILNPNVSPVTAQLYINGATNKTIYLYDAVNNLTFRNLEEGEYTVTVSISPTENYFSANASTTFNVGRYDPKLNVSANDINLGENATVEISAYNFTGNVILSINGVNSTVLIKNNTNITVPNLEGGKYDISVIFEGDSIYLPSNASATFNVIRANPEFDVSITHHDKVATIQVTTNANCTGRVGVYINFEVYYLNLTNGKAVFNVNLDSGTNYIFIFYDGDRNFENATYNTTIIIDEEFTIIGEDVQGVEYNNFTYSIVLVEKNRITMPGRQVSIIFNGQIHNVITDNDGKAGISLNLACGSYTISASYLNQTITNSILIKPLTFNILSSNVSYGENASIMVVFDDDVAGYVSFQVGNISQIIEINNSQAIINISNLKIGEYTIEATYFNGIFQKTINSTFEVRKATPKVDVKMSNILPGENETIEVTFLNDIRGNITITVNKTTYDVEINNSKAILNLTGLQKGIYEVSISYGGNENYTDFNYSGSFAVRDETSQIILNINNTYFGQDVIVKAKLNQTATGNITFSVSGISKTVEVRDGEAICTFNDFGAGTYRIDAKYDGDLTFAPSTTYGFFRVLKANSTISIVTDEIALGQNIMIYAIVSSNATGEVYFSMIGYYSPRPRQIENGEAFWYISPLDAGIYTVIASYTGDANYNPTNVTFTLKVSQVKSILSVSINDASINDRVTANIKLTDIDGQYISGKVSLTLNKRVYTINVNRGVGKLVLGKFNPGNYIFQAVYEGDDNYSTSSASGSFIVAENLLESNLAAGNVTAYYKGSQDLIIALTSNGKAISQATVNDKVNNVIYTVTTDNSGKGVLKLDLKPGRYVAEITFDETLSHKEASATALITVLSTVNATDVLKLYGTGTQYFAMFYKSDGKALGNTEVSFSLNGKVYKVKTLPNGVVRLNININPGTYKITATNPATGEKAVNTIRIYAKIMNNKDLTQYYGANKVFKVRIFNATTGNPVGSGIKVTFKLNKKTYTARTDKNGYASIKIKVKPGSYTIITKYDGYEVSNKIIVKPVLKAKNIIAKNVNKIKFKVKLLNKNGKPLKGKKITFKFKGKKYKAKTNKKGVATLTLKKLSVGKFKIKSIYGKSKITNYIKIRK